MAPVARVRQSIRDMESTGNLQKILPDQHRTSLDQAWKYLEWRMYQRRLNAPQKKAVMEYLAKQPEPAEWDEEILQNILHVMMSTPHYQVC